MALNDAGKLLIPPTDERASRNIRQWRWVIAVCVALLIINSAAGRGLIGGFGAYAANSDVKMILKLQYAEELRKLQSQMCDLPPERRATLQRVIDDYQANFEKITGRRYPLPPCTNN